MSGVDIAGLVERLRAAINLGDRTGSRGKRPENIYNVADDALTALLAQAAELAEARGQIAQLVEDRARFPDRPDGIGRMIQAHIGNLKAGKDAATEHAHRALDRAVEATRQRDEALAALKASEERGERLSQELASARLRPEPSCVESIARAIWSVRREDEDRCDMELEDMPKDHSVWSEARAVAAILFGLATEGR